MSAIDRAATIYVAGHRGMVGGGIARGLMARGYRNVVTRTSADLDLRDTVKTQRYLADTKPDFLFIAAARVGGIHANNTYRAEFLYENLMIEANLIHGAHLAGVDRLMFLGSSCIYPRAADQPIAEAALLTGPLEYTNEPYAIAKIAGVKLCESYNLQYGRRYFSGMPTNVYGPGDNYHPENSHVMAALLRKAHEAKAGGADEMIVWGTGTPRREFIHVDDLADACIFLMESGYDDGLINIGTSLDVTIAELAETIARIVGFKGRLTFDTSKPDGTPRKLMNSAKLAALGWVPSIGLEQGIAAAYHAAPFAAHA